MSYRRFGLVALVSVAAVSACSSGTSDGQGSLSPLPPYQGEGSSRDRNDGAEASSPAQGNSADTGDSAPAASPSSAAESAAPSGGEDTAVMPLAPAASEGTGSGSSTEGNEPATNQQETAEPAQVPPVSMEPVIQPVTPPAPPSTAVASPGCGASQGRPQSPLTIADPNTIVTFPPNYDGATPVPIVFAFHGANRTNEEMRTVDSRTPNSQLEGNYVMAFVKSQGTAWDLGTDYPRFQRLLTQILSERCIDTSAIFAMGHSSGAQFIAGMLGDGRARETRFAAVAPVSSNNLNNPAWTPVPTLLIHGLRDLERPNDPNGAQDIRQYAQANLCAATTRPLDIGNCASIANGGPQVNPGCLQYDGCAATTLFCNHNDPNYVDTRGATNHGWPCFANDEIFRFFEAAR